MNTYSELSISRKFSVINQQIRHFYDASFAKTGLTGTQATVIYFLYTHSGGENIYQRDIEFQFNIRRSSVTSVLQGLEQNGYILRESVPEDSRLKKLTLTDKAVGMAGELKLQIDHINRMVLDSFNEDEIRVFNTMLDKIFDRLDTVMKEKAPE